MAKQTRDVLKTYFEDGDTPDQIEFGHLIDSQVNLEDTGEQIVKGTLSASAVGANAYFLKGLAFEQVEVSQISLTGSNIFGSGGAAPTGVTSHSFFGPIYQSSSGADSASYFLTPVNFGTTESPMKEGDVTPVGAAPPEPNILLPVRLIWETSTCSKAKPFKK
jgi:hypothetical protein